MDKRITECTESLIRSIRESGVYEAYHSAAAELDRFPGMFDRIMDLRKRTIAVYHDPDNDDLLESSEDLVDEYEELQKIPEVNAFLEAEEELIRILQTVSESVIDCVDLRTP